MTTPYRPYIQPLIKDLLTRSQRAALGLLGLSSGPLRKFLADELSKPAGEAGSLLADPVFEPTFGWASSDATMDDLSGNLLHPRLVQVMANPPEKLSKDYTFPRDRRPFIHQLEAWQTLCLNPPRSLVVTSGTGSGKTECFLVPILDRLTRQAEMEGRLSGVRALFIYPLNALIASQQNRLDAWTDGLGGDVRYCLYTGNLPEEAKSSDRKYAGQVLDRKTLRGDVPPVLVTNATMLEYMLVRKEDMPILDASRGKLEWIVLDEAHTHIGSQAAEMALLLRRVMLAFGVNPENVRFVATSATFGADAETTSQLKSFLAKMAGVSTSQIHVVHGSRQVPILIDGTQVAAMADSLTELLALEPGCEVSEARYHRLSTHPLARAIRGSFLDHERTQVRKLSELQTEFADHGLDKPTLLAWLDLLSGTRKTDDETFLPLRIHLFHKVISGLHACVDVNCTLKTGTALADPDWGFGMVYVDERPSCGCGAPVLPLHSCNECNALHLLGIDHDGLLRAKPRDDDDEFSLDRDTPVDDDEDLGEQILMQGQPLLVLGKSYVDTEIQWLERGSGRLIARSSDGAIAIRVARQVNEHQCPNCQAESSQNKLLRRLAVGTPFTLGTVISTLLEYCPEDAIPVGKPFRGRKMISFTDSRQGTARAAVKLQQDSERNRVRALIYHHLLASQGSGLLSEQDEQDLADLELQNASGSLNPRDQRLRNRLLADKAARQQPEMSWQNLLTKLAGERDIKEGLLQYYSDLAPGIFNREAGARDLASMFLFREFARRPKRQNSLETMGLVRLHYPQLDRINTIPNGWPKDVASWRNYLKVLLDFYVRENTFIQINDRFLSVIGNRFTPKWLRPPTWPEVTDRRARIWPQVHLKGQQSRPVKLLLRAFGWAADRHRDQLDSLLRAAWDELTQNGLLQGSDSGYQLSLDGASFRLVTKAGICPVTRRLLDTPFEGLSPYANPKGPDATCLAEAVDLPLYPHAFGDGLDDLQRIALAREWLIDQPLVRSLRDEGLWSDLQDRIVEGGAYFRAVEHSAQQERKKLERYEDLFKEGKVNLMSCSTTMEMGVDIGGISVVAMNNVPPHPANYLQRAGRAGRRREARAVALTVCKNTPHDQAVFANPNWPFTVRISVPDVSLQSPELVTRHVQAWLLSHWLKHVAGEDEIRKMTCGPFFVKYDGDWSVAMRFVAWCRHPDANLDDTLRSGLNRLVLNTPLQGLPHPTLVMKTGLALEALANEWLLQLDSILQQQALFDGERRESKAFTALQLQIERLKGEYLLSELANRRFLPGYGFPTGVVCLDNRTYSTKQRIQATGEREDNRGRRLQLPSRDRATALREYAPGAEIVLDGLVYRSAGVTLNWHIPASETDVKNEKQLLKHAWRCNHCGCSGSVIGEKPEHCVECGNALRADYVHHYLVPGGFAVDFISTPHTDVSTQSYVPVKQPWLSVKGGWLSLIRPEAGRFRASSRAHLYHHSVGNNGNGYALCLECGRAEPMLSHQDTESGTFLPEVFRKPHKRLRGDREDKTGDRGCSGSESSWKIKQNIMLGHDTTTDALEIILRASDGKWLNDQTTAYSLAVAIRSAVAAKLGVLADELGCATRPLMLDGHEVRVIQVFDTRTGGYSVLAAPLLQSRDFWKSVQDQLDCRAKCAAACPNCLLSFDTRFSADYLDRHKALQLLTPLWLNQYELISELQVFGINTQPEYAPLLEALERELQHKDCNIVRLYWHGKASAWDLPSAHSLLSALLGWKGRKLGIELCAEQGSLAMLDESNRYKLSWLLELGASYYELPASAMQSGDASLPLLAAIHRTGGWHLWATDTSAMALPDREWGKPNAGCTLLHGLAERPALPSAANIKDIRPQTGDREVEICSELDGAVETFGQRFWCQLNQQSTQLAQLLELDDIVKLYYTDRYIKSPLPISLLLSVLHALNNYPAGSGSGRKCSVISQPFKNNHSTSHRIWHDWQDQIERDTILQAALEYLGFDADVRSAEHIPHGRLFEITFASGKNVRIRLDQGMSYWRVEQSQYRQTTYPFNGAIDTQLESLVKPIAKVVAPQGVSTQFFVRAF